MPPKKLKESLIFLINIGVTRHGTQSNSSLLDKEKFILKHIIQKKIFLHPKDEVGIVLMGSDSSENDSVTGMDNIRELSNMQFGNWNLIESIDKLQNTKQSSSWMEGIYAAVEYIKHECLDNSERKIMLLSDFNEEEDIVSQFEVDDIIKTLNSENIFLIAIGKRQLNNIDEDSYTSSEALLKKVLEKGNGQYSTFEHAMSEVRFYKQSSTKPKPWRCDMELGDFCIPIAGISKVMNEPMLPKMKKIAKTTAADLTEKETLIKNIPQWTDKDRIIHTKEDMSYGYMYGSKPIFVSDDCEQSMIPKTSEKCYKIHGFTARENVPMEYWLSDGTYVIIPADESVSAPFYSLVKAMVEKNVVAIIEKVYRKNTEANMAALFPSVDDPNEPWCLIEIGLPFERDYGAIAQHPLKFMMKQLSQEQSNAVDDLLTSLELPEDADEDSTVDGDKYLPGCMPNPGAQRMWDVLAARALHPDQPLPPITEDVKNLLEQPESVRENGKLACEKIKNLFSLEKKISSRTKRHKKLEEENDDKAPLNEDHDMHGNNKAQSSKEQEKDTGEDNNEVSKNTTFLPADDDFDFDKIANI
ncbi:X-ray repair cross-complementing protein 5-like isoform X1 [Harpegnathos saltator]|uniref:X-ray repair cross-complementing protein 5-like isoform X1 n=2 Tax=Harpegnathos saltator TaxID=610380 RepID=UPI00058CBBD2|nr:X-ray repair cross-complementing protein 5-like isoform X1 [Harpegnathos saltator]